MSVNLEATFGPLIKDVARSVSSRFPSNVLAEDTEQSLWVWLLRNKTQVIHKVESEPAEWIAQIASTMRKVAFDHCADEKAAVESYDRGDFQKYGIKQLRVLLSDVFDYDNWQSFATSYDGQPKAKALANMTGDRIAELVDVKVGVGKLNTDQYNLILWHYKYGHDYNWLAEGLECTPDAARQRVSAAVKALQKVLGPKVPVEETGSLNGRRSVRSNAAWRATNDNYYDE